MATRAIERRPIRTVRLAAPDDFDGWREAARSLALVGAAPEEIIWQVAGEAADLFGAPAPAPPAPAGLFSVSRAFVALAKAVVCHRDPERFALLYAMLVKLRERADALDDKADPLVHRLEAMARAVRRDLHKMHAFLRFREVETEEGPRFVAWFEPDHHIVRAAAAFFVGRFATHALVDPDARALAPLGRRDPVRRPRRLQGGRAGRAIRSRRCGRPIMPRSSIRPASRSARC